MSATCFRYDRTMKASKRAVTPAKTRRIRRAPSEMRAQALAAARRLIVQGSDEVLTMRAVADAAGVTYPNLSHHFGSAAGLHAAIAEDLVRELLTGLQTVGQEMDAHKPDYRALVDRVFDLFDRDGLARVLGWLVHSGEAARLGPVNRLLNDFIAYRSRDRSMVEVRRIARVALIVCFAAYSESIVGPTLGRVLDIPPAVRRAHLAAALGGLDERCLCLRWIIDV